LIGERVWDIMRLIDYAVTRPDVDARRVVITGNSGGGTVSLFAAACDERITVAVPSSYFCTFERSLGSIEHCACNYVPGLLAAAEMYDVAGLITPRPFLAVAGRTDPIFPYDGVELAFDRLQRIYAAAGVPERCELYTGAGGHRYYKARVWPFIRQWLP
jgi:dienelactone hydrolase